MNRKSILVLIPLLLLMSFCACTPSKQQIPIVPTKPYVPQPKTWDERTMQEHNKAIEICCSLLHQRLMGLATSQDAIDFVNSFFTHATSCLNANGDEGGCVHCPDNAWWLKIYGMFPTGEPIESQIDSGKFPLQPYLTPERWQDAVWLIYTDGRVEPFTNECSEHHDSAFNVEEDILKLNRGLQLDYSWRR